MILRVDRDVVKTRRATCRIADGGNQPIRTTLRQTGLADGQGDPKVAASIKRRIASPEVRAQLPFVRGGAYSNTIDNGELALLKCQGTTDRPTTTPGQGECKGGVLCVTTRSKSESG